MTFVSTLSNSSIKVEIYNGEEVTEHNRAIGKLKDSRCNGFSQSTKNGFKSLYTEKSTPWDRGTEVPVVEQKGAK